MKNIFVALLAVILMSSNCKKDPPFIPDDLLVQILTDGEWSITQFLVDGADSTQRFAGWRCKFFPDKVVHGKFNSNVIHVGTWEGDQANMRFTASFPSAASPVALVNGTWNITTPGTRIVSATQTVGTTTKFMKLYRE